MLQNRPCVAPRFLISVFCLLLVGSGSYAAAQSVSPRPVARLIGDLSSNSRPRGVSVTSSPSIDDATAVERRAFEVSNKERVKSGLAPLAWDSELCVLARTHSRNMSVLNFFSHQTPEGMRLRDRARAANLRYQVIAENIAYNQGFDDPGAFAVERWMISPGHRANLLSPEFQSSAIGSFVAPDGKVFFTQLFIVR